MLCLCRRMIFQLFVDAVDDHAVCDGVFSPFGNDNIRIFFTRLDKRLVHRLNGREILGDDRFERARPLFDVADDPPQNPHVGVGVDVNLQIEKFAQGAVFENQKPLEQNNGGRRDGARLGRAVVYGIVVDRTFDTLPALERGKMTYEQRSVEGVGVVVVQRGALFVGEVAVCLIIVVVAQYRDPIAEAFGDVARQRTLSAAGPSGDSDDEYFLIFVSLSLGKSILSPQGGRRC